MFTAYDILRSHGVPVGKRDYRGAAVVSALTISPAARRRGRARPERAE
ncbi:DUF1993 family protein [Nannocystis pusilla]